MYLWIKALHVISIISWMAALLYLPRLFVYHADAEPGRQSETFKIMEGKLIKIIMIPAMVMSWVTGLYMAMSAGFFQNGWFHGKLLAVVLLTAAHFYFGFIAKSFARGENMRSARFFRMINEVPTVLMIAVVVLVIVKPF